MNRNWMFLASLLIATAFVAAVQLQVVTYVCGNDPMLYIRAARVVLQPDLYGSEALRASLTFVAPGYPLLLAGVIKLAGPLAPYWSNAFILVGTLPFMWIVFRRLSGSARASSFMLLVWLWLVFAGHHLHAPFLLYPFREIPRMLLVYVAYYFILTGTDSQALRRWPLIAAGVAMLGACAIREPSILIMPGLLAGMSGLSSLWRRRTVAWFWVLLPWAIAAVPAVVIICRIHLTDFSQFSVIKYLGNHDVALIRAGQMMAWFPERLSWIGLLLIGAGIVRAGMRSRVMLAWFLIPASLFFVFHAYMQRHDRYFLTTIIFLAVFAGYGLDWLVSGVEWCLRWFAGKGAPVVTAAAKDCRPPKELKDQSLEDGNPLPLFRFSFGSVRLVVTSCAFLVVLLLLIQTVRSVEVWGPRIRAHDVIAWQKVVAGLEPSQDGRIRIAVEQRCRYLEDILMSYTDAELLDPKAIDNWPDEWSPAHYFRPLNREAEYATPQWLMYLKVYAHRIMANRMNVQQAENDKFFIGKGRYQGYVLSKWSTGSHSQQVNIQQGKGSVVWFDWGLSDAGSKKIINIFCADSGRLLLTQEAIGNGIQALFLDSTVTAGIGVLRVEFKSEVALPSAPVIAVVAEGDQYGFALGVDRILSSNHMFSQRERSDVEPNAVYWQGSRDFVLSVPAVISDEPVKLFVYLYSKTDIPSESYIVGKGDSGSLFVKDVSGIDRGIGFMANPGEAVELSIRSAKFPFAAGEFVFDKVGFEVRQE